MQLVECGISASHFRSETWKAYAVSIAIKAASALQSQADRVFYVAAANIRNAFLAHLYRIPGEGQSSGVSFPNCDNRSNALLLELAIIKAHEHINLNTLSSALEQLYGLNPIHHRLFTLEMMKEKEVTFMHAKVLRFEGRF